MRDLSLLIEVIAGFYLLYRFAKWCDSFDEREKEKRQAAKRERQARENARRAEQVSRAAERNRAGGGGEAIKGVLAMLGMGAWVLACFWVQPLLPWVALGTALYLLIKKT